MKKFRLILLAAALLPFVANAQGLVPEQITIKQDAHVFAPIQDIAASFDGGVSVRENAVAQIISNNGEIVATGALTANNYTGKTRTQGWVIASFDEPLLLPKGESYRFVIEPFAITSETDEQIVSPEIAVNFDVPATIGAGRHSHNGEITDCFEGEEIDCTDGRVWFYWPTETAAVGTDNVATLYREGESIGTYPFRVAWDWNLGQAYVDSGAPMTFDSGIRYSLVIPAGTISALHRPDILNEETRMNFIGGGASTLFFSNTTDISSLSFVTPANCAIFNIQGQRISGEPEHGIYIKCGKKFLK